MTLCSWGCGREAVKHALIAVDPSKPIEHEQEWRSIGICHACAISVVIQRPEIRRKLGYIPASDYPLPETKP